MAVTRANLRTQLRAVLASTSDWPDATLDTFIDDAIRFYSAEFPRLWRYDLSLTTGTQAYDLPGGHGLLSVVSVEYPTGEDPKSFLTQREEWEPYFRAGGDAYALRLGVDDTTVATSDDDVGTIIFAETVATGESAEIAYLGLHTIPTADTHIITVPETHLEALIAFVDFRCHWELEADEAVTVSNVAIVLSMLGQAGRLAWNRYKEVLDRLKKSQPAQSRAVLDWSGVGL